MYLIYCVSVSGSPLTIRSSEGLI